MSPHGSGADRCTAWRASRRRRRGRYGYPRPSQTAFWALEIPRYLILDQLQPAPLVGRLAAEQAEERLLEHRCDRAAAAGANRQAVDRADGRDLGGGAGEKHLISHI